MKSINLKFEDSLAQYFNTLSVEERQRIEQILSNVLEEIIKRKKSKAVADLMDEMANEAYRKGLTIAKLAELMQWNEETVQNLFGKDVASGPNAH